jgi:hypothetical protein
MLCPFLPPPAPTSRAAPLAHRGARLLILKPKTLQRGQFAIKPAFAQEKLSRLHQRPLTPMTCLSKSKKRPDGLGLTEKISEAGLSPHTVVTDAVQLKECSFDAAQLSEVKRVCNITSGYGEVAHHSVTLRSFVCIPII